jgi:hypothetical protein
MLVDVNLHHSRFLCSWGSVLQGGPWERAEEAQTPDLHGLRFLLSEDGGKA